MIKNKTIQKSFFWQAISILPKAILGPISLILLTRLLSVEEFGIYSVLMSLNGYVLLLASIGVPHTFRRYIPAAFAKGNYRYINKLLLVGIALNIIISLLIISIFNFNSIYSLFSIENFWDYFGIFWVYILFFVLANTFQIVFFSLFTHHIVTLGLTVLQIFRITLIGYAYINDLNLIYILYVEVVSYAFIIIYFIFNYLNFYIKHRNTNNQDSKLELKRLINYGGFSFLNEAGAKILNVATDTIIISIFLGPVSAGLYGFCERVINRLIRFMPHNLLNDVIDPIVFAKYETDNEQFSINYIFNFLTKIGVFVVLPISICLWSFSDLIIKYIFDAKYMDALVPLYIFTFYILFNSFLERSSLVLRIIEKPKYIFYSKIFAIYNLIGDIIVVKYYGIVGVAAVTASALIFKNIYFYFIAIKFTHISLNFSKLINIMINCFPLILFILLIKQYIYNIYSLLLVIFICIIIFLITCTLNKSFTNEERNILNNKLPYPIFIF